MGEHVRAGDLDIWTEQPGEGTRTSSCSAASGTAARASRGPARSTEMRSSAGFVARHPDGY
jgi:hypothetical protein